MDWGRDGHPPLNVSRIASISVGSPPGLLASGQRGHRRRPARRSGGLIAPQAGRPRTPRRTSHAPQGDGRSEVLRETLRFITGRSHSSASQPSLRARPAAAHAARRAAEQETARTAAVLKQTTENLTTTRREPDAVRQRLAALNADLAAVRQRHRLVEIAVMPYRRHDEMTVPP